MLFNRKQGSKKRASRRKRCFVDQCIEQKEIDLMRIVLWHYKIKGRDYFANILEILRLLFLDKNKPTNSEIAEAHRISTDTVKAIFDEANELMEFLKFTESDDVAELLEKIKHY